MNGRIPIKDIVALFESNAEVAHASTPPTDNQPPQLSRRPQGPPPSPARFIQHPLLKKSSPPVSAPIPAHKPKVLRATASPNEQLVAKTAHENNDSHPIIPNTVLVPSLGKYVDDDFSVSLPVNSNDRHDQASSPQRFMTRRMPPAISPNSRNSSASYIPLVPVESPTSTKVGSTDSFRPPLYQSLDRLAIPSSQTTLTDTKLLNDTIYKDDYDHYDLDVNLISSSSFQDRVQTQQSPPSPQQQHTPIAAKTIFSRGAAPLSLPALDNYLSKALQPNFTPFPTIQSPSSRGKVPQPSVFPPMDLLQASKKTLSDLENNATIPSWFHDRGAIFSSLLSVSLGIMGSSPISMYYSLQGLYDSLQLTALLLSTIVSHNQTDESDWRQVLLGTIPNILALNLGNTAVSLILFVILMIISACLLYYFHIQTKRISTRISSLEGLQAPPTGGKWGLVLSTFFLSVIYLPLSTISVHAIVWSSDFWPNSAPRTSSVCFTTTLDPNEINFGPPIVILAILTVTFLTIWFPIRLGQAIKTAIPTINQYTELGRLRNRVELRHAYERMLERDTNPLSFLYQDLRLGWATYSSIYLWIKLSTLLLVAVFDPNNCIFMHTNGYVVTIIRQVLLLLAMIAFLVVQTSFGPFLNPVSNASEWCSRLGYVIFALFGLIVALHVPTSVQNLFNGPFLYVAYILEYTFVFYFFLINFSFVQALVKKITRRMDFSIDIFSPKLDISPTSRHTRRRIWQESISVLSLLTPECMMPKNEKLVYTDLKTLPVPPYLIGFRGTVGERHVENLKILGEMGGMDYAKGIALCTGTQADRFRELQHKIQTEFTGPDCYWRDPRNAVTSNYFGNAWWIPFPPTLVMKYDSGSTIALKTSNEFEEYVRQNNNEDVSYRRSVRSALRSLDGQVVRWPYTHFQNVGKKFGLFRKDYTAYSTTHFESGVFSIQRNGSLPWKTIDLGSGFNVKLTYDKDVQVDGSVIGLTSDFELTPVLAKFLSLNRPLIRERTMSVEALIDDYRYSLLAESQSKADTLSYQFLCSVYGSPKSMRQLTDILLEERNIKLREMFVEHENAIIAANERMTFVSRSEAATWWYLFWDDLWRRNNAMISNLKLHASDFDPSYPSSIAYRLLPRAALEAFLIQRGLMSKKGSWTDFIHSGILNKIYFRLNQIVFKASSDNAIHYHLGNNMAQIDVYANSTSSRHGKSSILGTGGGTDYNDSQIRPRPLYRWEAMYDDPVAPSGKPHKRWLPKLVTWLGLDPYWEPNSRLSSGISLDVVLEDGNYVLLENAVHDIKSQMR